MGQSLCKQPWNNLPAIGHPHRPADRRLKLVIRINAKPAIKRVHQVLRFNRKIGDFRSRRVGGATYQVPMEVRPERRFSLAFRWLIQYAKSRSDKSKATRLANELMSAARGEGSSVKKKDDTHRMAEANRAFAHFRI